MTSSALLIDGKPAWRKKLPFEGPPGLPAMGHWEACLPVEDYAPAITPGRHRVVFRLGNAQSNDAEVEWTLPINWRKGNMKSRMKEVRDMASNLEKGLPRSCVEEWLTEKDGGVQETSQVRYFLEPQIKVLVPFSPGNGLASDAEVISAPVQVYQEPLLRD
jgi:hypothetical protein